MSKITPGQRVAMLRSQLQMTHIEFAGKVGLTVATVYRIENGEVAPRLSTLKRMAGKTGATEAWLLHGKGDLKIIPPAEQEDPRDILIRQLQKEIAFYKQTISNLTGNKHTRASRR